MTVSRYFAIHGIVIYKKIHICFSVAQWCQTKRTETSDQYTFWIKVIQ